jgi:hypothetical protein
MRIDRFLFVNPSRWSRFRETHLAPHLLRRLPGAVFLRRHMMYHARKLRLTVCKLLPAK